MDRNKPGNILIAEDEEDLRESIRLFFSSKGFHAVGVPDGAAALKELDASEYDLLLTDLYMPGFTGEELIESIEKTNRENRPAIIVMTGHSSLETAIKGIKAGVSAYIRKPINFRELEPAVRTAVEKRRLERELREHYRELDSRVEERTSELKAISLDLENKVNQLYILNSMGNRARVSGRLSEAAMVIVSSIVQALGFERVCLWVKDGETGRLSLAACHGPELKEGLTDEGLDFLREAFDEAEAAVKDWPMCGRAVAGVPAGRKGEVVVAPLITRSPDNPEVACWEYNGCETKGCPAYENTMLACWMIKDSCKHCATGSLPDKMQVCKKCEVYQANTKGRAIGVICADNMLSGRGVTQGDLGVFNIFANSAAAIIDNIRLMERLVENERFIDGIIFNMSSGLLVSDYEGKIRIINLAGAEIFKTDINRLTGAKLPELFPETARMFKVNGSIIGNEITIDTDEGAVPVGYTNSYLVGHDGKPGGVIVVFRDLSEIKRLHEQLREKDHFAAIGKVAAGVAHEIRNPLFGITSVAQILAREVRSDSPLKPLIDAMLSETSRLNTFVEDMLLYGRNTKLSPQPVDINSFIEGVLMFHFAAIKDKGLEVERRLSSGLPPLMLDEGQMRQVLLNLLVNAFDASNENGRIIVETGRARGGVAARIIDNGTGIPEDDLPKVFDLFYTTKEKGTGLGLAICRKIVEDHGGTVRIDSAPARGTTVELFFPEARR